MKKFLLLAMVVSLSRAYAQTGYAKLYEGDGSGVLSGFKGDTIMAIIGWGPSISIIDKEGNVIRTIHKWEQNTFAPWAIGKYTNNIFYYAGFYHDGTCAGPDDWLDDPLICRMDSSGNIMDLKKYELSGYCPGFINPEMEISHDGDATIWGGGNFFALHVDSNLNPIWAKHFNHQGSFQFIRELPSGDFLAGINMDTAGAVVARMDAVGNFLWCKSYIRPRGVVRDCLIESDSSFLITGYTDNIASTDGFDPLPLDYHPKLFMMELNGVGNVQWCKGYGSEPEWFTLGGRQRIAETQDGNYVLLANIGLLGHNLPFRPFLMKTDQNGDTLWTRTTGLSPFTYQIADLLPCPSGGVAFSGAIYGDLPNLNSGLYFIFKCDSLGHFSCNETTHSVAVLDLFPVDSSFTLNSVDGVTVSPAFVSDSLFPDISVYDACTIITSVSEPIHTSRVTIHPNPSTGRFTVEFTDPLAVDSFYSVYDAVSRLLFQRPLAKGQESEEIDLSRYGKGTYLVRVTSREGVCNERVVVQ